MSWGIRVRITCDVCGEHTGQGGSIGEPGDPGNRPLKACNVCFRAYGSLKRKLEKKRARMPEGDKLREAILEVKRECLKAVDMGRNGMKLREQNRRKEGISLLLKAAKIFEEQGEIQAYSAALGNLAMIYTEIGKFKEAQENHIVEERICREHGWTADLGVCLYNQGNLYRHMSNFSKACDVLRESVKLLEATDQYRDTLKMAKDLLAELSTTVQPPRPPFGEDLGKKERDSKPRPIPPSTGGEKTERPQPQPRGIALQKGYRLSLSKEAPGLKKARIGLGWALHASGGGKFDVDASAFLLGAAGKVRSDADVVFYNQSQSACGSVRLIGADRAASSDGDNQAFMIDLDRVPADVCKIAVTVTIHEADQRRQNFGQVHNAYIRLIDAETHREIARYDLGGDATTETALIFGELYRHGSEWRFSAVGQGYAGGLAALCRRYGVNL